MIFLSFWKQVILVNWELHTFFCCCSVTGVERRDKEDEGLPCFLVQVTSVNLAFLICKLCMGLLLIWWLISCLQEKNKSTMNWSLRLRERKADTCVAETIPFLQNWTHLPEVSETRNNKEVEPEVLLCRM